MLLSTHQSKIIPYLQQGLSNEQIGNQLNISVKTVKYHLTNIFAAYEVVNRNELIAKLNGYTKENRGAIVNNLAKKNELQINQSMNQIEKIEYINNTFKITQIIDQLHSMMKEVTKEEINPNTVNAACNCVARLNETINTTIQASRFLNER